MVPGTTGFDGKMHHAAVTSEGTLTMYNEATTQETVPPVSGGPDASPSAWSSADLRADVVRQAVSPSLRPFTSGDAPAYELKFLLDERQARDVEALLAPHVVLDPHHDPALGNAYRITTVYCDTPEFDVFQGIGHHRRRKYRARCYGSDQQVYLERKCKQGERVRKRRTAIPLNELPRLFQSQVRERGEWSGDWFHRQLIRRRLSPICCVQYLRTAYAGSADEGPIRLTFDRGVRGVPTAGWAPEMSGETSGLLTDRVVCEFKFRGALPTLFKSAIHALQLTPGGVSKYRHCMLAVRDMGEGRSFHA